MYYHQHQALETATKLAVIARELADTEADLLPPFVREQIGRTRAHLMSAIAELSMAAIKMKE